MTNIKILSLSSCSKREDLPEDIENHLERERKPPSSIFLPNNLKELCFHGCEGTLSMRSPNPVHLELPSLSFLHSLVRLELRNCNLRAVPNDIDSLQLLETLDLSENNFVCFPESIIRLSKLKDIYIENCTGLRSLPQFPLSTHSIWANGCTSLETLPDQLKRGNCFEPNVYLLNCFKLVDNQGFSYKFLTMPSRYFQELCYYDFSRTNRYDLIVPARKFPKWFSHQSEGTSVTLQVPPNFDEKCWAIGMCAAFEHLPSGLGGVFDSESHDRTRYCLHCRIMFNPKGEFVESTIFNTTRISFPFPKKFGQVESRHLWLIYLRREFFCKIKDCVYSKGLHKIGENGFDLWIVFLAEGTGLTVTKCGAHFVFKQDIEDLSKTNEMDFVFYDNHLNSEVPADGTSRVEPSHDGNYDGAGPSGEGSCNELRGESSNDGAGPSGESSSLGNWFGNLWR